MLLPRFTIRTLLIILTVCACVFVVIGTAYRGQYWAWGVTIALVTLIVTALVHAAWYSAVWLFSQTITQQRIPVDVPPFRGPRAIVHGPNADAHEQSAIDRPCAS